MKKLLVIIGLLLVIPVAYGVDIITTGGQAQIDEIEKIDSLAVNGMGAGGVNNSLAYKVHEIEKHLHPTTGELWFGDDGDSTMSQANSLTAWELTAGTGEAFGTEVLLGAANDVLAADGNAVKFDLHRISVTESNTNDKNYEIEFWYGTGAFGAATRLTGAPYRTGSNAGEAQAFEIMSRRITVAQKIWARIKCETNGAKLEIIIGIHTYEG